jgi:hypothetical protein
LNLDQSQAFPTSPSSASNNSQQEHSYPHPFLQTPTHLTISAYSLPAISSIRLLRIRTDMRVYRNYISNRKERGNGQICLWRSYMCLLARLYIWGFTTSLDLIYIGIPTLIRALYIRFQHIYHSVALSKLRGSAIFHALRTTKERGIIYLGIRSSGISLNLLLPQSKLLLNDITLLLLK